LAKDVAVDWFLLQGTSQRQGIEAKIVDVARNAFATEGNDG
jgi:hypothetical protein